MKSSKVSEKSALAQNIIAKRKALRWTQLDLAEKARVHLNVIKKIENDKSQGWQITREAIAKALNCSVSDLYSEGEPPETKWHEPSPRQLQAIMADWVRENDELKAQNELLKEKLRSAELLLKAHNLLGKSANLDQRRKAR